VRLSVSHTVDQSKTVEVRSTQSSPCRCSSHIHQVFAGKVLSINSDEIPQTGASDKGGVGKHGMFYSFMHQYVENGKGKGKGRALVRPILVALPPQRRSGTWRAPSSVAHTCLIPSQPKPVLIYRPREDGG